jgi:hypothetical protein
METNGDVVHDQAVVDGESDGLEFKNRIKRINSIGYPDEEGRQRRKEQDEEVASYVSERLRRMRTDEEFGRRDLRDEIEAQLDGSSEPSAAPSREG